MANQVFISYRRVNEEHRRAVRRLGDLLRQAKIEVALDDFYADANPGGPNSGWPKWCEDCANQSRCVLIIASEGWFAAYDKLEAPGIGLGAASEADIIRQSLYDEKGDNSRFRLAVLDDLPNEKIPTRLRAWNVFRPFAESEQLNQLIRWVAQQLMMDNIELPTAHWPAPVPFQPDLANRNKKEWPAIVELLAGRSRERILLFEGEVEVGKSELLRQARAYAQRLGIPVAPIDFKGGNVGIDAVLGQLDLEIGMHLPSFAQGGSKNIYLLRKDFRALRHPVLLTFDTYEDVADNKTVADWINQELLREVETALSLCIIVAGRIIPDRQKHPWRAMARQLELRAITEPELWEEWVDRRFPAFPDRDILHRLVKASQGLPNVMRMLCENLAGEG